MEKDSKAYYKDISIYFTVNLSQETSYLPRILLRGVYFQSAIKKVIPPKFLTTRNADIGEIKFLSVIK